MKRYIFTESQIKKIIDSQMNDNTINEQYGYTDSPKDIYQIQLALNRYFKANNIRGIFVNGKFQENTSASLLQLKPDGVWGNNSKAALIVFQQNNGLSPDGVLGCKSVRKLVELKHLRRDLWSKILSVFGWDPKCE